MADKVVAQAILQISLDDASAKRVVDAIQRIGTETEKTGKSVRNMSQLFSAKAIIDFGKAAAQSIVKVTSMIIDLGERGAVVGDVANSFDVLTQKVGSTSEAMLGELREGTVGALSDFDLMKLANKALGAGLVKTEGDMGVLAAGARALAKQTGGDTTAAFETLTGAIASGRTASLKQMGVFVDSKVALQNYSVAIGKSESDLTDMERATALSQAAVAALRQRLQEIPPDAADFGERIAQAKVSLENMRDEISLNVAQSPVLQAGLNAIGKEFTKAFGGKEQFVATVTRAIEEFVIILAKTASVALDVAQVVTGTFFAWKKGFNAVLEFFFNGITKFHQTINSVAGALGDLTGIDAFHKIAANAQTAADKTSSLAFGFGELKDTANESGVAALDALGKTQQAIDGTIAAMEANRGKVLEVKAATDDLNRATGAGGEAAAGRSLEAAKAALEGKRALLEQELALGRYGLDQKRIAIEQEAMNAAIKVMENRTLTQAEADFQLAKIEEIKDKKLVLAQLEGDELKLKAQTLKDELAVMQQTGLDAELMRIDLARQKELQGLEVLKVNYGTKYTELTALVNQKYAEMSAAAQGHFATAEQAAEAAGFKTKAEQEKTAQNARRTYEMMKASGNFTYAELQKAHEAATEAEMKLDDTKAKAKMLLENAWVDAAIQGLQMLGGKNKVAAIAAVVISTAQAVMKTWAQLGWPAAIPGAVMAVATGAMQVAKINSQKGFKEGTPNLDFARFGTMTQTALHGNEAVIPQGKGHMLAGEIADSLPRAGGGADLDHLADRIIAAPINPARVDITIDGRKLGEAVLQLSRTGQLRIHSSSLVTS